MSDSALRLRNRGAYTSPFSGVGVEFFPLGVPPDHSGFVLHEAGYLANNDWWDFPNVLSPFWRLYYNGRRGHKVIFAHGEVELTPETLVVIPDRQLFHCRGFKPVPNLWLAFNVTRRLAAGPADSDRPASDADRAGDDAGFHRGCFPTTIRRRVRTATASFTPRMALLHVVLSRPEIQWQQSVPAAVVQTVQYIEETLRLADGHSAARPDGEPLHRIARPIVQEAPGRNDRPVHRQGASARGRASA